MGTPTCRWEFYTRYSQSTPTQVSKLTFYTLLWAWGAESHPAIKVLTIHLTWTPNGQDLCRCEFCTRYSWNRPPILKLKIDIPLWAWGAEFHPALKSFKGPGNTFHLSSKWIRTLSLEILQEIFIEPTSQYQNWNLTHLFFSPVHFVTWDHIFTGNLEKRSCSIPHPDNKNVYITFSTHNWMRTTHFWNNHQSQKIGKHNNLNVLKAKQNKGPKQDIQNQLGSPMSVWGLNRISKIS
jgi:hypothetical protein